MNTKYIIIITYHILNENFMHAEIAIYNHKYLISKNGRGLRNLF